MVVIQYILGMIVAETFDLRVRLSHNLVVLRGWQK